MSEVTNYFDIVLIPSIVVGMMVMMTYVVSVACTCIVHMNQVITHKSQGTPEREDASE